MKLAVYYICLFVLAAVLYLTADKAKRNRKILIAYLCYFMIFTEVLILI